MTINFRIDAVRIDTSGGPVDYAFRSDLTVLAGNTGVGKTSLLELVKFALGGDGLIAQVAQRHASDVQVSVHVGDSRFQLTRGLEPERRGVVRVVDLVEQVRLQDHSVGGQEPTVSNLLLGAMGFDTGMRAAARGNRSTSGGAQITFNDIYRYMYVPQSVMNQDIAGSKDSYYEPKRKAVFELLFDLTSPALLQMRSDINRLRSQIEDANREAAIVKRFLEDTKIASRTDALAGYSEAEREEEVGRRSLEALKENFAEAIDQESKVLRDLLTGAERSLAEANELSVELSRQRAEYEDERRRVTQEISRLERMESAGMRLASIEFSVCPRCTQRLDKRDVPKGRCRVCLLEDVLEDLPPLQQYETEQLRSQVDEVADQLRIIDKHYAETMEAIEHRTTLVRSLTAELDARTRDRITPRLQAYADATARIERAIAEQRMLNGVLQQWDRAHDLEEIANELVARQSNLIKEVKSRQDELSLRRSELFEELDAEFQATVMAFGIPSVESASINPDSYLPYLNGQLFTEASAAGGIITATQVAYWITLITVAARRRDTNYPAFLMLDSPRLALNAEDDIAGQMYRRFRTQVDVGRGRLQFIVADNELPTGIDENFARITFSYDAPTIATIPHPGPADVHTLTA